MEVLTCLGAPHSADYGVFQILVKRVIMIFFSPFFLKKKFWINL